MRRTSPIQHLSYLLTAIAVGGVAVYFAKLISFLQSFYFQSFRDHPWILSALSPLLFVLASGLVVKLAPQAKGSGIPQVLQAIDESQSRAQKYASLNSDLVSMKTAVIKVLSMCTGILAGASIGREGPTVQISASLFALTGRGMKRHLPQIDYHSYLVAGGAAGVAAAFNAPLAGITFALEEIAHGSFDQFKEWVIVSVVIAGVTAQAIAGNYLYLGHPQILPGTLMVLMLDALLVGAVAGSLGALFSLLLTSHRLAGVLPKSWWLRAFLCGSICSVLILALHSRVEEGAAGSGYEIVRTFMDSGTDGRLPLLFPLVKFFITIFSYLSGMAAGIFAPCLTIGSGIGFTLASILQLVNLKSCALFGMVAFFSGAVQAPLTAVVIVMEMSDHHQLILPFFCAAYSAQVISRRLMPISLYRLLASRDTHLGSRSTLT